MALDLDWEMLDHVYSMLAREFNYMCFFHPPWGQSRDLSGKSREKLRKTGEILEGLLEKCHGPRMVEYFSPKISIFNVKVGKK